MYFLLIFVLFTSATNFHVHGKGVFRDYINRYILSVFCLLLLSVFVTVFISDIWFVVNVTAKRCSLCVCGLQAFYILIKENQFLKYESWNIMTEVFLVCTERVFSLTNMKDFVLSRICSIFPRDGAFSGLLCELE